MRDADQTRNQTKRDEDDLVAQQGMEVAAKRMADYTVWQVIIRAIGSIFVAGTLYQSLRSIRHGAVTLKQNKILIELTEKNSELQLKAYPNRAEIELVNFTGQPRAELTYKNFGQTPCVFCDVNVDVEYYEGNFNDAPWKDIVDPLNSDHIGLAPGDRTVSFGHLDHILTAPEVAKIVAEQAALIVRAEAVWKDVLGTSTGADMCGASRERMQLIDQWLSRATARFCYVATMPDITAAQLRGSGLAGIDEPVVGPR